MAYALRGEILEVCDCNVLCPCLIGENPDNGTCQSALVYRIETGMIAGVDVSGLVCAIAVYIPGNILEGNFRAVRYVDDRASPEQEAALLKAFRGELGGPLADLAQPVGGEVDARRAPISFTVVEGKGTLCIGETVHAEMEPYRGSPAYVGKAGRFRMVQPEIGIDLELAGHNAIQGYFDLHA
jgi:hypothetical protein